LCLDESVKEVAIHGRIAKIEILMLNTLLSEVIDAAVERKLSKEF
jgi:hypothetical protein